MSTFVPDGISFADLQKLAKDAPEKVTDTSTNGPHDGLTDNELKDLVDLWLTNMHETNGSPMFAKCIVWQLMNQMVEWHTSAGLHQFETGEPDSAKCWLRDAGKFQAILNILHTINLGDHDFITPE